MEMAKAAREHMLTMKHRMAAVLRMYQKRAAEESRDNEHHQTLSQLLDDVEKKLDSSDCNDSRACQECRQTAAKLVTVTRDLAKRVRIRSRLFRQRMARWARRSFLERSALFHQLKLAQERDAIGNKKIHALQVWYLKRIHSMDQQSRLKFACLVRSLQQHESQMQLDLESKLDAIYKRIEHLVSESESNSKADLEKVISGQATIGQIASGIDSKITLLTDTLTKKLAAFNLDSLETHSKDHKLIIKHLESLSDLIKQRMQQRLN
jgi:hypothetical protein